MSEKLTSLTYIRLSRIERGEVVARAAELQDVARVLDTAAVDLLVDVDAADFDIAEWVNRYVGTVPVNPEADSFSALIAAAVRCRRLNDPSLTIATLDSEYGIAPVILSRIENAQRPYNRLNDKVRAGLRMLLDAEDDAHLLRIVLADHVDGKFEAVLPSIVSPQVRMDKSRARISALRRQLAGAEGALVARREALVLADGALADGVVSDGVLGDAPVGASAPRREGLRMIPVLGAPLPDGLIAAQDTGLKIEAPASAGPRAYGLRLLRPTLGIGLPGRATLIIDPDRFPTAGDLAVIRSDDQAMRVVSTSMDREGRTIGFSQVPAFEIRISDLDPDRVAGVIAAIFD